MESALLTRNGLVGQIMALHAAKPLSLSNVVNCVPGYENCAPESGSGVDDASWDSEVDKKGKGLRKQPSKVFASCEELVDVFKLFPSSCVDSEDGSKLPERPPPKAFFHRRRPHIIVWESPDIMHTPSEIKLEVEMGINSSGEESSVDLIPADLDFYERGSSPEQDQKENDSDVEGKVANVGEESMVSENKSAEKMNGAKKEVDKQSVKEETEQVDESSRGGSKEGSPAGYEYEQDAKTSAQASMDTNGDARKFKADELEGIDHLQNDMKDVLHLEGRCDSNEDLRGKPGTQDMSGFDHLERGEDSDDDDFSLGNETNISGQPIPLKRSKLPARPLSPPVKSGRGKAKNTDLDKLGDLRKELASLRVPEMEDDSSSVDSHSLVLPSVPAHNVSLDADVKRTPLASDPKPIVSGSLETLTEVNESEASYDTVSDFAEKEQQVPLVESIPSMKFMSECEYVDPDARNSNEDLRNIHKEDLESVDHLRGVGEDHLEAQILTGAGLGQSMALSTPCIDHVDDVILGGGRSLTISKATLLVDNGKGEKTSQKESSGGETAALYAVDPSTKMIASNVEDVARSARLADSVHIMPQNLELPSDEPSATQMADISRKTSQDHQIVYSDGPSVAEKEDWSDFSLQGSSVDINGREVGDHVHLEKSGSPNMLRMTELKVDLRVKEYEHELTPSPKPSDANDIICSSSFIESFAANVHAIYQRPQVVDKAARPKDGIESTVDHTDGDTGLSPTFHRKHVGRDFEPCCEWSNSDNQNAAVGEEVPTTKESPDVAVQANRATAERMDSAQQSESEDTESHGRRRTIGTGHESMDANIQTSKAGPKHTTISPLEVDIAVERSPTPPPVERDEVNELGEPTCAELASSLVTRTLEPPRQEGQLSFSQSHGVTIADIANLGVCCFDLVFWVCLAVAVIVFEFCQK